jgi:hypothetical protein
MMDAVCRRKDSAVGTPVLEMVLRILDSEDCKECLISLTRGENMEVADFAAVVLEELNYL